MVSVPASLGVSVLTLTEARALIGANPSDLALDDPTIQRYIDSATGVIERYCGNIVVVQRTKTYDGGVTSLVLPWRVLTAYDMLITENGVPLTPGVDFDIDGDRGILYRGHWPITLWFFGGRNNISVTVYVGRDAPVPGILKDAVAEQFRLMWQGSQQSPARPGLGAQIQAAGGPSVDPIALAKSAYGILPGFA